MTPEQKQALTETLTRLGSPAFEVIPGEDEIPMLHIEGHFICGVLYALSLPDEQLKALIEETVQI